MCVYIYTHTHTHTHFCSYSFPLWLTTGYWIWPPMLSRRPLLFIHSICKSLHLITLDSQSISTPPSYHDLITVLIQISLGESLRDLSANCLTGRYRKFQGCRGLRSDREESQCRAEAMLPGKFALGAAGGLSETLGDDEEQAPGEREKALGRITITFLCCMVSGCFCELFCLHFYAMGAGLLLQKSHPNWKIKCVLESPPTQIWLKVAYFE